MVVAHRKRAVYFTVIAALGGTAGAVIGYYAALFAFGAIEPALAFFGVADDIALLSHSLNQFTFLAALVTSLTPLPDVPLIIAAGALSINPIIFFSAYFTGRIIRLSGATFFTLLGVSLVLKKTQNDTKDMP
jgi:membrane protein YqaA with SNARE-associated domain